MSEPDDVTKDWVYRESTKKLLMRLLLIGCAVSVLLEFLVLDRKAKFGFDGTFGFYAILGFGCCTAMIFLAKGLGLFLKVRTDFYEKESEENTNRGSSQ